MDRVIAANVFVRIVEQGSLTAAADSLDMSRSMVSRYLGALEDWAGARLLHRSTRSISLSPAGEVALARCRELLQVADSFTRELGEGVAEVTGTLRLACSLSCAQDLLLPILQCYSERYPEVLLDLQIGNSAVDLVRERIDLAIRITNDLDPNLIARSLGDCRSVICAAPAYLDKRGTPLALSDLNEHNCLNYSRFGKSFWQLNDDHGEYQVAVSGNFAANDPSMILQACQRGLGIALQPRYSVQPLIDRGQLVPLLPAYEPKRMGIYALYRSREHMPRALRLLLDMLAAELRDDKAGL
ncbi:MAG: LysR family transcriptional regulator [Pseudomonadales bacterium]